MIVFDLRCTKGHVFEAWFGSSDDYASQCERGLVECPFCGDKEIGKAVMAPAIPTKSNRRDESRAKVPAAMPSQPEHAKAMLRALATAQQDILDKSEYVGGKFANEARAIHLGEAKQRGIYGEASPAEVRDLIDEGVAVAPLPLPVRKPGSDS